MSFSQESFITLSCLLCQYLSRPVPAQFALFTVGRGNNIGCSGIRLCEELTYTSKAGENICLYVYVYFSSDCIENTSLPSIYSQVFQLFVLLSYIMICISYGLSVKHLFQVFICTCPFGWVCVWLQNHINPAVKKCGQWVYDCNYCRFTLKKIYRSNSVFIWTIFF